MNVVVVELVEKTGGGERLSSTFLRKKDAEGKRG